MLSAAVAAIPTANPSKNTLIVVLFIVISFDWNNYLSKEYANGLMQQGTGVKKPANAGLVSGYYGKTT